MLECDDTVVFLNDITFHPPLTITATSGTFDAAYFAYIATGEAITGRNWLNRGGSIPTNFFIGNYIRWNSTTGSYSVGTAPFKVLTDKEGHLYTAAVTSQDAAPENQYFDFVQPAQYLGATGQYPTFQVPAYNSIGSIPENTGFLFHLSGLKTDTDGHFYFNWTFHVENHFWIEGDSQGKAFIPFRCQVVDSGLKFGEVLMYLSPSGYLRISGDYTVVGNSKPSPNASILAVPLLDGEIFTAEVVKLHLRSFQAHPARNINGSYYWSETSFDFFIREYWKNMTSNVENSTPESDQLEQSNHIVDSIVSDYNNTSDVSLSYGDIDGSNILATDYLEITKQVAITSTFMSSTISGFMAAMGDFATPIYIFLSLVFISTILRVAAHFVDNGGNTS